LSSWDLKPTETVDDHNPHIFKATYRNPCKEGKVQSVLVVKFPTQAEMVNILPDDPLSSFGSNIV
jgi:hypothetical protein